MSERYKTLYRLPENLYSMGSPVIIAAGALLKDNQSGKVLAQIKFKSISDKRIKAVKIRVMAFDVTGASVGDAVEHQYLDLNVNRNDEFGSKEAVSLALDTTRSFSAQVSSVIFSDSSIWEASNDLAWDSLLSQSTLSSVLQHDELVEQYMIETGSIGEFIPTETADLWLCSCGTINHKSEEHCVSCKMALAGLLAGLDVSMLTSKKDARLEAQFAAEKKAAEEQLHKQIEKKKKTKKLALVVVPIIVVCIIAVILATNVFIPQSKYNKAVDFLNSGNYTGAISQFSELGNYKDSVDMLNECNYQQALFLANEAKYDDARTMFSSLGVYKDSEQQILATYYSQGEECLEKKDYAQAAKAFTNAGNYLDSAERGMESCGKLLAGKRSGLVSVGYFHIVGLRTDGTVFAGGINEDRQCNVENWTDIVAVSASGFNTVGLRADGTVVSTTSHTNYDVSSWTGIIAVSTSNWHTVGVRSDGTVVATGSNTHGECNVSDWTGIIAVSTSDSHTVGLRADGTVVATGENSSGQCDVSGWTGIVAVSADDSSNDAGHTVGLRADGTVVATGSNTYGECNVSDWTGIVAVSVGGLGIVGLRTDGTAVTNVANYSHYLSKDEVSGWTIGFKMW